MSEFTMKGDDKQIVCILCVRRSGSTLLKALLGVAEDVSHIPEVFLCELDWSSKERETTIGYLENLAPERIVVIKNVIWPEYPLDLKNILCLKPRVIFLRRDVVRSAMSLVKVGEDNHSTIKFESWDEAKDHWMGGNEIILRFIEESGILHFNVKYEDIVMDSINTTREVFEFIGSRRKDGTSIYCNNYGWKWGTDDGGELIKTLKVQKNKKPITIPMEVLEKWEKNRELMELRKKLGYRTSFLQLVR